MIQKILFGILGVLFLFLGTVGIFLPVMPTVPFYLLATFCLTKSSTRFHDWFKKTKTYQKYVLPYTSKKGMPFLSKLKITVPLSIGMLISYWWVKTNWILVAILIIIWIVHVLYLYAYLKTIR